MNGYRKIVAMVKDRKDSRNYSFDRYMNLHLQKAGVIFNKCYNKEYIQNHKEVKEYNSRNRIYKLINPNDGFIECKLPKVKVVATIDLTKAIPSTQSQEVVEAVGEEVNISSQAGTSSLTKQKETETSMNIITIQSTQSQEVVDVINLSSQDGMKIPSTQSQVAVEETHASFATVRDEAISSIVLSEDPLKFVDSEQPSNCIQNVEIYTEEVVNQNYDYFDMLVMGQVQSTQNSEPLNQYFTFSPNQEKANDINWDDG